MLYDFTRHSVKLISTLTYSNE